MLRPIFIESKVAPFIPISPHPELLSQGLQGGNNYNVFHFLVQAWVRKRLQFKGTIDADGFALLPGQQDLLGFPVLEGHGDPDRIGEGRNTGVESPLLHTEVEYQKEGWVRHRIHDFISGVFYCPFQHTCEISRIRCWGQIQRRIWKTHGKPSGLLKLPHSVGRNMQTVDLVFAQQFERLVIRPQSLENIFQFFGRSQLLKGDSPGSSSFANRSPIFWLPSRTFRS